MLRPRPGGYPGTIMRFKFDENLHVIADVVPERDNIASDLCRQFIDAGMVEDSADYYGASVLEALGPQYVSDVTGILAGYLYGDPDRAIPAIVWDAFCKLIIMGDDDCPECGGLLKLVDMEGDELKDGDRLTPNTFVPRTWIYKCAVCGKIIKTNKEL